MPSPSMEVLMPSGALSAAGMMGMVLVMMWTVSFSDFVVNDFKRGLAGVCFAAHVKLGGGLQHHITAHR